MGKIRTQSIITFVIFIIILIKHYLFNILQVFPPYGKENRLVSWVFILPLIIIGTILFINVTIQTFKSFKKNIIKLYLTLPFVILVFYLFL